MKPSGIRGNPELTSCHHPPLVEPLGRKRSFLWVLLAVLLVGLFYLLTLRPGHSWGDDFALYLHLAKNLADGNPYAQTGFLQNPDYVTVSQYPPVFPLLLVPIIRTFGLNLTAMKAEIALFFLLALGAIAYAFRRELSDGSLFFLVLLLGLNPSLWEFKDNVLSDFPFLCWLFCGLILAEVQPERETKPLYGWVHAAGTAFVFFLAYSTRSVGIVLTLSLLLRDLLQSRRIAARSWKILLLFGGFALVQWLLMPPGIDYWHQWASLRRLAGGTLRHYFLASVAVWGEGASPVAGSLIFAILGGLAILGLRETWREGVTIRETFLLCYSLTIVLWPYGQAIRFLIPLLPLLVGYALVGLQFLGRRRSLVSPGRALGILTLLLLSSYAWRYRSEDFGPIREGIRKRETQELLDFVRRTGSQRDVYVFRKARVLSLFTGRRAAYYSLSGDDEHFLNYLGNIRADYVIVGDVFPRDRRMLQPFIDRHRDRFAEVYSNGDFRVYRFLGGAQRESRLDDTGGSG